MKNTIFQEVWATHEIMRRCGIKAEHIWVHIGKGPDGAPGAVQVEGGQIEPRAATVLIDVGRADAPERFPEEWKAFALKANAECHLPEKQEEYTLYLRRAWLTQNSVEFVVMLLNKGFQLKDRDGVPL